MLSTGEEIMLPVNDSVSVVISEEDDLGGSVWQFESIVETTTLFNPQGCEDVYVRADCTCTGDYTGITHTETNYQTVTGQFTVSSNGSFRTISFSNVSGSFQVHYPSSEYSKTCPLGGGLGVPGCACTDPNFIRIDSWGVDEVNQSISFSSPTPGEDEFYAYVISPENTLSIDFYGPPEPEPLVEMRSWYSVYSDCSCIGWDGQKSYDDRPAWGFNNWSWEGNLQNGQWTEVEQWYNSEITYTFSLVCISNCDN
jgi:hypothetical protein